jgi:hypothetical protein
MGAVKKVVGSIFGGGSKPKAAPVVAPVKAEPAIDDLIGTEEERQKKARVALNAGDQNANPLGVTAPATVTKRNLLGL